MAMAHDARAAASKPRIGVHRKKNGERGFASLGDCDGKCGITHAAAAPTKPCLTNHPVTP